ncbi:MAG: glutamate--cysteine ligase [Alphaproteobacteria bacterium]
MSVPQEGGGPVENRRQLVEYLEDGCKPRAEWRIGTEHEKFGFQEDDFTPLPYEGPRGIETVLKGLMRFGWEAVREGETLVGLTQGGASISLEPGGQLELSGAPLDNLHQTCDEAHTHLHQVKSVCEELGIGFIGLGMSPKWTLEETPVMPKGRYGIMKRYMPTRGRLGRDMMFRTCTIQTNLDFSDEADMVRKLRTSLALQPIATALFANSPFTDGKPNGFLSWRAHVWTDTDPDRTGLLPFVFEDGFGFERWVDYALDVPMYFIYRNGAYLDVSGQSFRDFLEGRLPALPGEKPTLSDWADHLTTLFPEARIKRFMEMRGADGGPWSRICALPAFWAGLLYDSQALGAAWQIARDWTAEERETLRRDVARLGLKADIRGRSVRDIASECLTLAQQGLKRRARAGVSAPDETVFLDSLFEIAAAGRTPAEDLLEAYHGRWQGDIDRIFREYSY